MLNTLKYVVDGLQYSTTGNEQYEQAYPESVTDWSLVTEMEIFIYLGGQHAGASHVNWTVGAHCEVCGNAKGWCPGHRADGTLLTYKESR